MLRSFIVGCHVCFLLIACGAGPNIFPGVILKSERVADSDFVKSIVATAQKEGFVVDPSGVPLETDFRSRHILLRWRNQQFPALAIDTHKSDGLTYVVLFDSSVGGNEFPAESAAIVRRIQVELHKAFPNDFKGGLGH